MKPIWLVGAGALVAFLVWRRRRLEPTMLVGGAIVAVLMAVYGTGLVKLPNLEEALGQDRRDPSGRGRTGLLARSPSWRRVRSSGSSRPGETALLVGGLVAGQGQIDVVTLIGIVWACAVAGDLTSFFLGRRLGRQFMVCHGSKVQITEERLAYRALDELRRAGVVKAIGVGVNESAMCARFANAGDIDTVLLAGRTLCWSSRRSRTSCRWR